MIVLEFRVAGLEFIPVLRDYQVAAHARLGYSFVDVANNITSLPLLISVGLLLALLASQQFDERSIDFRCTGLAIAAYFGCQLMVNMTNSWNASMWLAPAAVSCLVVCMKLGPSAMPIWSPVEGGRPTSLMTLNHSASTPPAWLISASRRLATAIPFLIFVMVLVPEILSSMVGITVGGLVILDLKRPIVVTAGRGVSLRWLDASRSFTSLRAVAERRSFSNYVSQA